MSDLPPVGELVQITDHNGHVSLGYRHHLVSEHWLERLSRPPIRLADVQSWCRVLVLPDTEDVEASVRDAIRETHRMDWVPSTDTYVQAVMAAVRGAAIR